MDATKKASENITQSSFAAMAGVLFSRASGVVRTIIVNASFGAATALDAFNAAFRLPNSLRDLFADGALSAAFMTALVAEKQKGLKSEQTLISIVLGFFGVVTLLIAVIAMIFSEQIINLITDSNFKITGALSVSSDLFKFLIFYLPLTMVNAVIMAILGVHQKTFRAMNGSIFLSVGMICGALLFAPLLKSFGILGIYGLAFGALLGAVLQMLYQMLPLFKLHLIPLPNLNPKVWLNYKPLRKILIQMTPRAIGQGAMVIALSINTYFATQIGTGFLTYIVTAVTIIQVPIGLFGVATGFAALPALLATLAKNDDTNFSRLLIEGLRTSFWLASFTTLCFALLIFPFYVVLFQHGKITFFDSINNSIAICAYSTGIILASGNKILLNTLFALDGTRQIVYNAFLYLIVNTLLNIYLVPRFGVVGIGISFGIATSMDFWINYFSIKKYFHRKGYHGSPYHSGGKFFTYQTLLMNLATFVICLVGVWLLQNVWSMVALTFWEACIILVTAGSLISAIFVMVVYKFGPPHLKSIFKKY
ncbi:MAG: murein biosynthesis integral membrane protein MurJ [Gammaproteobacteria bacterium]|nr:murein biosynthesis integral membrane protein MurJ [Gammaproteobacteria bacterium]